jgi:dienelactone hydrolase
MIERRDVEFEVEGGDYLRGWLFVPAGTDGARPVISMAHGYASVKEQGIEPFARAFAEAGFVVLLHDHRNFGASDGAIRHDVDPWRQIADWRRAISFLESQPEVDATRIGVWGTSYAGGHVIVLGATDRRIRAVASPSAGSSRVFAAFPLMPSRGWRRPFRRMSVRSSAASRCVAS